MADRPAPSDTPRVTVTAPEDTRSGPENTKVPPDPHATRNGPGISSTASLFPFLVPPDRPGDLGRLGGYRVRSLLGEGGMGFVFLAEDEALLRPVALKVMRPEVAAQSAAKERFLREGRAAAALKSDYVVTIYQVGEANGVPFLALECLEGESLADWLKARPGRAPAELIARVARDVLTGLARAHVQGLVHRDVKPANLWVEAPNGRVKVLDFGLTKPATDQANLTKPGAVIGTPAFMAPEQARGDPVDARADLWSLGLVLYTMASGANPFQRDSVYATLQALSSVTPPPAAILGGLPPDLARLIDRLMRKDPAGRPADAGAALAEWQPTAALAPRATRRGRMVLLAAAGMLAAVLALALWDPFAGRPTVPPGTAGGRGLGSDPAATAEPIRITAFDIEHLARTEDGRNVENRGVFGKGTFAATQKDYVKLRLTLSRPGYAFLIAFRPDGVIELCYPNDDFTRPPLAEAAAYPFLPEDRNRGYGLSEAPGLWTFAAVVSDTELPTFDEWKKVHPLPEMKGAAGVVGAVLVDDGTEIDNLTTLGPRRGTRGKGEHIPGQADIEKVGNALNRATPKLVFQVVGITATPAK